MTSQGMRRTSRHLVALGIAIAALAAVLVVPGPGPAAGAPAPPKLLGPVLSRVETPSVSLGRDGGFSASLPNGYDFWVFADTPRYEFRNNKWRMISFITGSTAGMVKITPGKPLTSPLTEVRPGALLRSTNPPAQFMPTPVAYLPDGSGNRCDRGFDGTRKAFSVRWPVGAALMPDKTNVLVPYAIVCVLNERDYYPQGWGFSLFNYKTQRFTQKATDVVHPKKSGEGMSSVRMYGSPLILGKKVTFYSWRCCSAGSGVYSTTLDATVAAMKKATSYTTKLVPSLPGTFNIHAAPKSKYHSTYTMYVLTSDQGGYAIYTATNPKGPWKRTVTGVLPRCNTSAIPCHSMALHPELSPAGRLNVSYHLPGYGPAIATKHPYPHEPLRHVVSASIPCGC
jgi:hypothetical protein